MSYSCDHSDNDPLMQELRELRLADEAKDLGFKTEQKIHLASAQFISDTTRSRLRRLTSGQKSEEKKQPRKT
jgi:hypothetical protein